KPHHKTPSLAPHPKAKRALEQTPKQMLKLRVTLDTWLGTGIAITGIAITAHEDTQTGDPNKQRRKPTGNHHERMHLPRIPRRRVSGPADRQRLYLALDPERP